MIVFSLFCEVRSFFKPLRIVNGILSILSIIYSYWIQIFSVIPCCSDMQNNLFELLIYESACKNYFFCLNYINKTINLVFINAFFLKQTLIWLRVFSLILRRRFFETTSYFPEGDFAEWTEIRSRPSSKHYRIYKDRTFSLGWLITPKRKYTWGIKYSDCYFAVSPVVPSQKFERNINRW